MLLENYKEKGLLLNLNFLSATSTEGISAFRGELVLVEGKTGDSKAHSKTPEEVMRGVAILADTKMNMIVGAVDKVSYVQDFINKYKTDFDPKMKVIIYVVNIEKAIQVAIDDINFVLIPLVQGIPWNELLDELALDKSDLKGLSAADKVMTVFSELQSYQPSYPTSSIDDILASATDTVREGWGAI